jgi:uncharacterized protein (TIGR01777 family)
VLDVVNIDLNVRNAVLLSGASGMLGEAIRSGLAGDGIPILRLVRRPARAQDEVQWEPQASPAIAIPGKIDGLRAAIHLSGASVAGHRWNDAYKRRMIESRVGTTRALVDCLTHLANPPKTLLVASAIGIYGDRGDEVLNEVSQPGTGFLADLCREWEAAADGAAAAGIRVVHLRFGVVLGHGGALSQMLPIFRLGLGGRLGSGRQWMSWVSGPDVVAAVQFLLDTPELAGPVNVTAPQPVSNAEFTRALGSVLHRPALLPAPALMLRLVFGEMAQEALLASQRALPSRLVHAGFRFAHPKVEAALAAALAQSQ